MSEKVKLLLIEDDPAQTYLIRESLGANNYEISSIQDGQEALDFLMSSADLPDLILLDYHLPTLDGLKIMNLLKEQGRKFNIVFLTADYSIETAISSINAGALEFIPKDGRFVNNIATVVNKAYQTIKTRIEREKFESALRESESRFKMVMEASKDGIFEWDSKEGILHISPNLSHLLGYTVEEYPKDRESFFNLVHPEDRQILENKVLYHIENNTPLYEAEVRLLVKDNTYKWVLERGIVAEKTDNSNPARIIGTHSDISERKASEEKLIEANRKITTLIGNLPGIVYSCKDGNIFYKEFLGGQLQAITGYSVEELLLLGTNPFSKIVFPEDKAKAKEIIALAIKKRTDYELYYRIVTKTGNTRWIWDHGKVVDIVNLQNVSLEGYLADITEKKSSDEALRQSEEEKNIILDNSLQVFILLNSEGEVIAFNKVANHRAILTVGKSIKKGTNIFEYMPADENERTEKLFRKVVNGEPAYWEQSVLLRNQISWYENVLIPVFISRDEIKFVCFTSSDITERKLAEEKIKYSEYLYNTTINSLNDLLFVVDENLNTLFANEALLMFNSQLGVSTEFIGKKIPDVYPFFRQYETALNNDVFHNGKELVREDYINLGIKFIYIEIKITPVYQEGKVVRAVTIIRDITERKNFEKKIMNAIIETEERERKRFSEDLHDEMGSLLSTIKIYINTLHQENIEVTRRSEMVGFTNQLIDQAIQNSKEIANNLSPNIIKRFGLISALQSLCDKIRASSGIVILFNSESYRHHLKEDEEISIYRIVTELINNTLKHAGAGKIEITFLSTDQMLYIAYSDDGKGFDLKSSLQKSNKGLGLQNIVSRISSLNGTYSAANEPGTGTVLRIELIVPTDR
jgi:PAS domain S-box-containing protein